MSAVELLHAEWPAPPSVRTAVSTRRGGVSTGAFQSLNLGDHVGDAPGAVQENRRRHAAACGFVRPPRWLSQVHGCGVTEAGERGPVSADASITREAGVPCVVLTADCLPVLFCSDDGQQVAAAHAGWRGLAAGVLEATVARFVAPPAQLMAWLGPAIGPAAFQVGTEVRAAFVAQHAADADAFHVDGDRFRADLFALARARLARVGVQRVFGGGLCTVGDPQRWFSHRRDGASGRFASAIWRQPA